MGQRTNSPIDDPAPYNMPEMEELAAPAVPKRTGINKKQVDEYINGRIDYFEKYLPNGTAILDLPADELGRWWQMAASLKAEFQALNNLIQTGEQNEPKAPAVRK